MNEFKPVRYALMTTGRTGSTILSRMLREHPNIVDYQELFNVDYQAEYRRCTSKNNSLQYWLQFPSDEKFDQRNSIVPVHKELLVDDIFRDYVWHEGYTNQIRAVGFKLLYYQLKPDGCWPDMLTALHKILPTLRVILLSRENHLETYVSHLVSSQNRQWHITDEKQRIPRPRIKIESHDLKYAFEHYDKAWDHLCSLASHAESQLELTYNQLINERQHSWIQSLNFLNVPEIPLPPLYLKKLENRMMQEAVVNYQELKRCFTGSKWENCFND